MKEPEVCELDAIDLRVELEQLLGEYYHAPQHISRLERRPFACRTSFALEELEMDLEDGRHLQMLCKSLARRSLDPGARRAKPRWLHNAMREIETYRRILMPHGLTTCTCYGASIQPRRGRYLLFIERVNACELFQMGDFDIWEQVARWLAGMHTQFAGQGKALERLAPLIVYDRAFYHRWITRARAFSAGTETAAWIEMLAQRYDQVVDRMLTLGETLLHGEFYASNILVLPRENGLRVCPVDWEMAAIGPGLIDLGALIAGNWSEEQKRQLARAYYLALPTPREWDWEVFLEALDYCRLHLAVQWLGWSAHWSPPPEHAQNWLREAISLAERLEL